MSMRRLLCAFVGSLLLCLPLEAAFALIQTRSACGSGCDVTDTFVGDGSVAVTGLADMAAGNTAVAWVFAAAANVSVTGVTGCSGTWTELHTLTDSTRRAALWGTRCTGNGTSVTVTTSTGTGSDSGDAVWVRTFSGGASPFAETGTSTEATGTAAAQNVASVTPAVSEVLFACIVGLSGNGGGWTNDTDFTWATRTTSAHGYRIQSDTTAQGCDNTTAISRTYVAALAAIAGDTGGAPAAPPRKMLLLGVGK
jgi:hypothetical protein